MTAFEWTDAILTEALGVRSLRSDAGAAETRYAEVSTDSRTVGQGALFVALVGDHFDGHEYVSRALSAGATGLVVSRDLEGADTDVPIYHVPDTLVAYGALAAHRRTTLAPKVVGITGSSGKTTTKDLTTGALSQTLRTHATQANFNNRVGLPRTILEAPVDSEVLVLEMGTSEPGEIAALTRVATPDVGVVTTVSESHLEGLGSLDGVLEEKLDLLRGLGPEATAIVGDDPEVLPRRARELVRDLLVAGLSDLADSELRASDLEVQPGGAFRFRWQGHEVALQIPGDAAVVDALLALSVAQRLGVPAEAAARGVGSVGPGWMRGEVRTVGGLTLVLDCYNANPQSVRAAVRTLTAMPSEGARVLVLGSMLELGAESLALHTSVLAEASDAPLDRIYASGLFASAMTRGAYGNVVAVEEIGALAARLVADLEGDETVLLKASRGVQLERVLPTLVSKFGGDAESGSRREGRA